MDLSVNICGMRLKNPTILASGVMGVSVSSLGRIARGGAGAVTVKSISREERMGHGNPTMFSCGEVFMNAVGYSNGGVKNAKTEFADLSAIGAPVIGSIIGTEPEDFRFVAQELSGIGFRALEIPLSCPHTPGFGLLAGQGTPEATYAITKKVRESTTLPVIVKLSPSIPDIHAVAQAALRAGADALNMGNAHGPGMRIDIESGKPVMDFKVGGLSGPAIKPITVRCVYDLYESVKLPIIGTGGILTGRDAIEMLMAGASAVGIGTAVYYRGFDVFRMISEEMAAWLTEHGYSSVDELVGVAHG